MQFDYPTSLFVAATIDFVVAFILKMNSREHFSSWWLKLWIIGFIIIGCGNLVLNFKTAFDSPLILLLSNITIITGGVFLITGLQHFLKVYVWRVLTIVLPVSILLANIIFNYLWINDLARKMSFSLAMVLISLWVVRVSLIGLRKEKQKAWLLLLVFYGISVGVFMLRFFVHMPSLAEDMIRLNRVTFLFQVWAFFLNITNAVGIVWIFANHHLNIVTKSIAVCERMYSIIGHDLKEPLAHIYTLSNIANNPKTPISKKNEIVDRIRHMASQANFLAHNLLDWANALKYKDAIATKDYFLHEAIQSELAIYKDQAKEKNLQLQVELQENIVLSVNENIFRLIVRNIINNAAKHTPENGTIRLTANNNPNMVTVAIQNTGPVLDDEIIQFMNDPHPQKEINQKGLGLLLIKRYANLLDIKINVQSHSTDGTIFYLFISEFRLNED